MAAPLAGAVFIWREKYNPSSDVLLYNADGLSPALLFRPVLANTFTSIPSLLKISLFAAAPQIPVIRQRMARGRGITTYTTIVCYTMAPG